MHRGALNYPFEMLLLLRKTPRQLWPLIAQVGSNWVTNVELGLLIIALALGGKLDAVSLDRLLLDALLVHPSTSVEQPVPV